MHNSTRFISSVSDPHSMDNKYPEDNINTHCILLLWLRHLWFSKHKSSKCVTEKFQKFPFQTNEFTGCNVHSSVITNDALASDKE